MKTYTYFAALFLFVAFGCGSSVTTQRPNDADLSSYKTFAYLPNRSSGDSAGADKVENSTVTVIKTVNGNMENAGYTLDREDPDLLVLISSKVNVDTEQGANTYAAYPYNPAVTTVSPYYNDFYYSGFASYGPVAGYNTNTYSYEEGIVVVDIIDRVTKKSIWKGSTSEPISDENRPDAIAGLINDIFKKYPLKKGN